VLPVDIVTVRVKSVSHADPRSPHAFTCKMCVPAADPIEVSMDGPSITVVSALLSNEYPIAATLCDEQLVAEAERVNDVPTSLPLEGLLTVTPASAGIARVANNERGRENFLTTFMRTTEEKAFKSFP